MPRKGDGAVVRPPTLGSLFDVQHDLSPHCNASGRHGDVLRIEMLVERFGRDMLALRVHRHLVCGQCGSKSVGTHVRPRNQPFTPGYKPPGSD
jgi:hypothetical protein